MRSLKNLPSVSEFVERQGLRKVTCHGCTVGLRASDTGDLMCKSWTIATSHAGVLKHMHLPCQKNHRKTACESGRPKQSAFYTPVFAKKVIEAMQFHEPWSLVVRDLQASPDSLSVQPLNHVNAEVAAVAASDLPVEEQQRIQKLLNIFTVCQVMVPLPLCSSSSEKGCARSCAGIGSTVPMSHLPRAKANSTETASLAGNYTFEVASNSV